MPDETPDQPGQPGPHVRRLAGMTDSELIDEGSRLAGRLASLDEGQLTGIAMLLVSAALAVFAVLLARQGMAAVRGEAAPHGSFRG